MAEGFVTHMEPIGWSCPMCTYINFPSRPGCEICAGDRPMDYQPPPYPYPKTPQQVEWEMKTNHFQAIFDELQLIDGQEEPVDMIIEHRPMNGPVNQNELELQDEVDGPGGQDVSDDWREVIELDNEPLTVNQEAGECSVCLEVVERGLGIKLKECFHIFCRSCLQEHIDHSTDPDIQCPQCPSPIQEREIRALVDEEAFDRYHVRCVTKAEASATEPTFHCQAPNCPGWCYYEENVDDFRCYMCRARNCINCRAIHDGVDCMTYQQQLAEMAENDEKAKKTQDYFDELITNGEAMLCPRCKIIITKKGGCDWLCCPVCRVEICWVTKGPRWGPRGVGDNSGGCHCRLYDGKLCSVNCTNCH